MSHFLSRMSLKFRLTLTFVFIVSFLLTAVIVILGLQIGNMIREDTDAQMQQIAIARADQVGELLGKLEWQLRSYGENDVFTSHDTKKINAYLEHLMGRHSNEISNINYAGIDGKGHSSLGNNIDISQRDYFKQVITLQNSIVISEALISQSTKKPSFIMALKLTQPNGTFDGVLSFTVSLEKFSELTSAIKIGKSGYSWICDSRGIILAFPEEAQILKLNINSADQQGYRGLTAFAGKLMQNDTGTGDWVNQAGSQITSFYSKIDGAPGWKLGINLPTSEVNRTFTAMISILVLVLILGIISAILMAYFLAKSIVKPIQQAALGFKELAQGEADLTKQISVLRQDEVGQMVQNFNHFVVKLREMVLNLKDSQVQISKVAQELSASSVHTVSTVAKISDNLAKAKDDAEKQNESALQSAAAVSEIAKNIESLDKIIADQAASVVQASSSVEEMTRNIESVFLSMEKLSQEFKTLSSSAEEGKVSSEQSSLLVKEIFERSNALQEANKAVASIASQTNLLAMNAAIEAAHAGQSGKGFAVVADEIRKLAESSSLQSKSIGDDIGAVQKGIQELVDSNASFTKILNELELKVSLTQNIVKEVHSAMSEQQEGSRQMLLTLGSLNTLTSTVKNGSQEMKSGNDTLIEETQNLRDSAQSILVTMDEITQSAQILKEASKIVADLAEDTKSSTQIMETSIGRFKI